MVTSNSDNPSRGRNLEMIARAIIEGSLGIVLQENFSISVGLSRSKEKAHRFDLGCSNPRIIVECKNHGWTAGGNAPSAKMSVWNEAMLYFLAAPKNYRKIMFIPRRIHKGRSLFEYYVERYGHLIPDGVEFWEYNEDTRNCKQVRF